ncbi:ec7a55ff-1e57-41a1-aca4-24cb751216f4 [Thermothielavioides terrestris]|uniref:Ec7a55ff-1e57-41a1-aca4-24cb751216f4 n=1 Tax=Thermothielavioides terrestris TaxID=2587410 RepID=A0A3S4D771_9PEZI|nr:ec7a55ff-1e57-41a1-aca4-24cb751216f4 [Thermothielavioides terrestris]
MYPKFAAVAALLAVAEARFGQEGKVESIISALSNFGQPGQAATLAGATPGVLLAGANACAKLQLADQIVATLGNDPQVISAAAQLVAAEKNFNPFAVSIPSLCSDASLPATPELRGIVPLVDPAVIGSDVENANSAKSLTNPFNADGLSVADVAKANGFSNFTTQAADGTTGSNNSSSNSSSNNSSSNSSSNNNNSSSSSSSSATSAAAASSAASATVNCGGVRTLTTVVVAAPTATQAASNNSNNNTSSSSSSGSNNVTAGVQQSTIAGLDFGLCVPTMKFVGGLGGRPATEFTFQAIDPKIAAIQQEALNPNIITNRICDELTNQCEANQAAKDACAQAKAQIQALGTRDATTAETWNSLLGFAGVDVSQN